MGGVRGQAQQGHRHAPSSPSRTPCPQAASTPWVPQGPSALFQNDLIPQLMWSFLEHGRPTDQASGAVSPSTDVDRARGLLALPSRARAEWDRVPAALQRQTPTSAFFQNPHPDAAQAWGPCTLSGNCRGGLPSGLGHQRTGRRDQPGQLGMRGGRKMLHGVTQLPTKTCPRGARMAAAAPALSVPS